MQQIWGRVFGFSFTKFFLEVTDLYNTCKSRNEKKTLNAEMVGRTDFANVKLKIFEIQHLILHQFITEIVEIMQSILKD